MTKNSFDEAFVIFVNELKKDTNREKDFNKISNLQEAIDYATDKAYRDMQLRTIKGHKIDIKNKSIQFLKTKLNELFVGQGVRDFDSWHNGACETFLGAFNAEANKYNVTQQGHGKAQKIVNMSLKYLYCIFYCNQNNEFDDNINRFDMDKEEVKSIFEKCHMPLDSYTLNWYYHKLGKKAGKNLAWSSLKKGTYDIIEKNIKEYILNQNEYPRNVLQAEFVIWQQEKTKMEIKEIERVLGNGVFEEGDLSQLKSCKRENVIIENAKKIIKVLV